MNSKIIPPFLDQIDSYLVYFKCEIEMYQEA